MDRFYMLVVRGFTKNYNLVKDRSTGECVQMPINLSKAAAAKHAKKLNAEHTEPWAPASGVPLSVKWGARSKRINGIEQAWARDVREYGKHFDIGRKFGESKGEAIKRAHEAVAA